MIRRYKTKYDKKTPPHLDTNWQKYLQECGILVEISQHCPLRPIIPGVNLMRIYLY